MQQYQTEFGLLVEADEVVKLQAEVEQLQEDAGKTRGLARCLYLIVPESKRRDYRDSFPWLDGGG